MALIESFGAAVIGGIVSLVGREVVRKIRAPELDIALYNPHNELPYMTTKEEILADDEANKLDKRILHEVYLVIKNTGKKPARDCRATLEIFDEEEKRIPKTIFLGLQERPVELFGELNSVETMSQRTAPFTINRSDEKLVDFVKLQYNKTIHEYTEDVEMENRKLATLDSYGSHEFEKDRRYRLEVKITATNTDPNHLTVDLHWNGGVDKSALADSISIVK